MSDRLSLREASSINYGFNNREKYKSYEPAPRKETKGTCTFDKKSKIKLGSGATPKMFGFGNCFGCYSR